MATRALAADGEQIEDDETTVTSALAVNVKAFLPAIDDGAGTTVNDGFTTLIHSTGAGDVEIVDIFGRRVVMVQAGTNVSVEATGDVDRPVWVVASVPQILSIAQAEPAAGTTTPALGTTCPAASATVGWIGPVQLIDGTLGYIPFWT